MRLKTWLLIAVAAVALALPASAFGQCASYTTVTGTVTDPSGIPWNTGTVTASITPTGPNSPTCTPAQGGTNLPFSAVVGPTPLDGAGSFSLTLPTNSGVQPAVTQWQFHFSIVPGVPTPFGTGPQFFTVTVTLSGSSQSINSQIVAAPVPHLTIPFTGGGGCPNGSAGCANEFLSNLQSPTAANQDLLPQTDDTQSLGTPALRWGGGAFGNVTTEAVIMYASLPASPTGSLEIDSNGAYQQIFGNPGESGHLAVLNNSLGSAPACANGAFYLPTGPFEPVSTGELLQYCGEDNGYHFAGLVAPDLSAFSYTVESGSSVAAGQFVLMSGLDGSTLEPTYSPAPAGTTSGVVGVALTSAASAHNGFLIVPVGTISQALMDNSCSGVSSVISSSTTTGYGHCTTSPGTNQVLGYVSASIVAPGLNTMWGAMGGTGTGGSGSVTNVFVNSTSVTNPNFNGTTPAAPAGNANCTWQVSGSNVSCYLFNTLAGLQGGAAPSGQTYDFTFAAGLVVPSFAGTLPPDKSIAYDTTYSNYMCGGHSLGSGCYLPYLLSTGAGETGALANQLVGFQHDSSAGPVAFSGELELIPLIVPPAGGHMMTFQGDSTGNFTYTFPAANGTLCLTSTCTGSPGGATNSFQYNNGGVFGGVVPSGYAGVPQVPSEVTGSAPTVGPQGVPIATAITATGTLPLTARGQLTPLSSATASTLTLPAAGSTNFDASFPALLCNSNTGTWTFSSTSTIFVWSGSSYGSVGSPTITTGQCVNLFSDNTNWYLKYGPGPATGSGVPNPGANGIVVCTGTSCSASATRTITGTANQIAVTNADGTGGNPTIAFPSTIVIPTGSTATTPGANDNSTKVATTAYVDRVVTGSALIPNTTTTTGTTAISANSCSASATTVTMTGVTTSMAFIFTPSTDVSAVTGWGSSGGLVIDAWPTANTLNYKICNQTASSITPGSVTWNVGVR